MHKAPRLVLCYVLYTGTTLSGSRSYLWRNHVCMYAKQLSYIRFVHLLTISVLEQCTRIFDNCLDLVMTLRNRSEQFLVSDEFL